MTRSRKGVNPINNSTTMLRNHPSFMLMVAAMVGSIVAAYDVPSLTPDNYDELTSGKTVFIKFFAPWCGHCKKMAPDWERLAEEWSGNAVGLVAEVDCTAAGKPLCDANGVRGFPTLKWGDPDGLVDYEGSRALDELQGFAKEHLKPICSAQNMDLCDGDKLAKLERYMELSVEILESKITEEEAKLATAESEFKDSVTKLQAEYQRMLEEKDKKIAAVRESGLTLMKSVLSAKQKDVKEEL